MADISLSKAVRTNLMALQSTATMMSKTQERLATGNKVNSALDNPTNYFTASGLNNRASDLGNLLDTMSNSIKTLEAADKGIKAIEKLVKSAQSTVNQALQDGSASSGTQIQGNMALNTNGISGDTTKERAENQTLAGLGFADNDEISLTSTDSNGTTSNVTITIGASDGLATTDKVSDLLDKINTSGVATAEITDDGRLNLTANGNSKLSLEVIDGDGSEDNDPATGATDFGTNAEETGSAALTDTVALFANLGFAGAEDIDGATASDPESAGGYNVGIVYGDITADGGTAAATLSITSTAGESTGDRTALVDQFNSILKQIDDLAQDSSFNGVNLIASDSTELKIAFNERRDEGKSEMTIKSKDLTSTGLDLIQATTLDDLEANDKLDKLTEALVGLRSAASSFGSQLTTVQTREDFTKEMVDVLESGAANLTLADMNKEAANLLALQTRQQLSSSALAMASQADQSVLQLLR